jgi:hypothetical protein
MKINILKIDPFMTTFQVDPEIRATALHDLKDLS